MAISITDLATAGDTTDRGSGSPYTTASVTLETGRVYLLACAAILQDTPLTPTVSSTGATWTIRESVDYQTAASPDIRICVFVGTVAAQQIGSISIEYASTVTCCAWSLSEVTGMDTAAPIVQDAENRADTGTSFGAGTLASFGDAVNNAMYAVVGKSSSEATTKEAAHTALGDVSAAGSPGTLHLTTVWFLGEDLTANFGSASNRNWGGIMLEIKAATAAGPLSANKVQRSSKHTSRLAVV